MTASEEGKSSAWVRCGSLFWVPCGSTCQEQFSHGWRFYQKKLPKARGGDKELWLRGFNLSFFGLLACLDVPALKTAG